MEKKNKESLLKSVTRWPVVASLFVAIIVVWILYVVSVRSQFYDEVKLTTAQNVEELAHELETSVHLARSSVKLISVSVANGMDSSVLRYPKATIENFLPETPFARIDYIRADGLDVRENGASFDASHREVFKKGIAGETGVWVNFKPKYMHEALVNFYTPLTYNDNVVGVLTGVMGGVTKIRPLLKTTLFGKHVESILCDNQFNIIVSTLDDSDYGLPFEDKLRTFVESDEVVEKFKKGALEGRSLAFQYKSKYGTSIASVAYIRETGWYLIQIIPYTVLREYTNRVTMRAFVALFLVTLLCALCIYFIQKNFKRQHNEVSRRQLNVINALTESYGSVFEVNLETGLSLNYRIAPTLAQKAGNIFEQNAHYNQIMAMYVNHHVASEDRILFDQVLTLDRVARIFEKKNEFGFVFQTRFKSVTHYVQCLFVKPSNGGAEFVMGFKNIDEIMNSEFEKRQKLNEQRIALEKALNKLREADEAKSRFLFNMSHDIRTPMNAVLGYGMLSQQYLWELGLPPEQTNKLGRSLQNIQASGNQLMNLINSMLNLTRIESGKVSLEESPTLVADISRDLVTTFEHDVRQKNIMLQVSRSNKQRCIVCDSGKIQQILLNVVSNAVAYTNEYGSVRVNFRDLPHEKPGWCYFEMAVEDNGVGISEEFLPHVFDAFERENSATSTGVVGTGLGLCIVKKFVDLMQGTIEIDSKVGEGTKVVVRTPHRIASNVEIADVESANFESVDFSGKRILLAEDNEMNRHITVEMLKNLGIEVDCAVDGLDCLEKMQVAPAGSYDMILMDIQMPRMDGFEATKAIRKLDNPLKSNIVIYAFTANAFEEDRQNSLAAGMDGHISKPIEFEKLSMTLAKVLGAKN